MKKKNGNIFAGQADEKRPLGRPRCRWEGHHDKDLKTIFMVVPCINGPTKALKYIKTLNC